MKSRFLDNDNLIKNPQTNPGFTLLELIIVIILIGVLASLALPRYSKIVEWSRATEALSILGNLRNSLEICYISTRNYLPCGAQLDSMTLGAGAGPGSHFIFTGHYSPDRFTIFMRRNSYERLFDDSAGSTVINACGGTPAVFSESAIGLCSFPNKVGISGGGFYEGIH